MKILKIVPFVALIITANVQATSTIYTQNKATSCSNCHAGYPSGNLITTGTNGLPGFCLSKYPTMGGAYNGSFVCTAPAPTSTPKPTSTPIPTTPPSGTPVPTTPPTSTPVPTSTPTSRPTSTPTPIPVVDTKPVIINQQLLPPKTVYQIDLVEGIESKIPIIVHDDQDDAFVMLGNLPKGDVSGGQANFSDVYQTEVTIGNNPVAIYDASDIVWTPVYSQTNKKFTITVKAKETVSKKLTSAPFKIIARVWSANEVGQQDKVVKVLFTKAKPVVKNNVKVISLQGKLILSPLLSTVDKKAFYANTTTIEVSDNVSQNSVEYAVVVNSNGIWTLDIPFDAAPCSLEVDLAGHSASKIIAGKSNCQI